jgi:hypothetical protein
VGGLGGWPSCIRSHGPSLGLVQLSQLSLLSSVELLPCVIFFYLFSLDVSQPLATTYPVLCLLLGNLNGLHCRVRTVALYFSNTTSIVPKLPLAHTSGIALTEHKFGHSDRRVDLGFLVVARYWNKNNQTRLGVVKALRKVKAYLLIVAILSPRENV